MIPGVTRFAWAHGQTISRLHCSSCSNVKVTAKVTINLSNENDVIIHVTSVDWWTLWWVFLIDRNSQVCKRGEFFLSRQLQSCSFSNISFLMVVHGMVVITSWISCLRHFAVHIFSISEIRLQKGLGTLQKRQHLWWIIDYWTHVFKNRLILNGHDGQSMCWWIFQHKLITSFDFYWTELIMWITITCY